MSEYIETLNQEKRLYVGTEKRVADFPESVQSWKDFESTHK
jgi:hypothetical protein